MSQKDMTDLRRKIKKLKWTTETLGSGHERWTSPAGQTVTVSVTCNGGRNWQNMMSTLKKAGYRP